MNKITGNKHKSVHKNIHKITGKICIKLQENMHIFVNKIVKITGEYS